jgi:hypothetical protein
LSLHQLRVGFPNNSNLEEIAKQRGIPTAPPPNTAMKSVEAAVGQLSMHEIYDIIAHFKDLAESKPEDLRHLLIMHPQVAEAVVHMQLKIGMIKPPFRQMPQEPAPIQPIVPPSYMPPAAPAISYAPPPMTAPMPSMAYPGVGMQMPMQQPRGGAPQGWNSAYAPPPQQPAPQPQHMDGGVMPGPAANLGSVPPEVLKQVLELTPEQLAQIDPARRQMLMDLRQKLIAANPSLLGRPS